MPQKHCRPAEIIAKLRQDEHALTAAVIGLARSFGRYGYKRITGLLQMAGWNVNAKRVPAPLASRGAQGALKAAQARPAVAQ